VQCVIVCGCTVLQCVKTSQWATSKGESMLQHIAACCPAYYSVLQSVAVCCSVLPCVAVCCSVSRSHDRRRQRVSQCCSMLQRVAACCSVLQCVEICCSVLQCVAVCCSLSRKV